MHEPTRLGNILNVVLSSEKNIVEHLYVYKPFGIGDHWVVRWKLVAESISMDNSVQEYIDVFKP